MDTNVKRLRFNPIFKALCIVICLVTFMSSVGLAAFSAMSYAYCGDEIPQGFTDANAFEERFGNAVDSSARQALGNYQKEELLKIIPAEMEKTVNEAYEIFTDRLIYVDEDEYNDGEYYSSVYINSDSCYIAWYADDITVDVDSVADYCFYTTVQQIFDDYYSVYGWGAPLEEENVKKIIGNLYDSRMTSEAQQYDYDDMYYLSNIKNLYYYTDFNGSVSSNIEPFYEEEIYSRDIYFVYKNGEVKSKGFSNKSAEKILNNISLNLSDYEGIELYFYFDFKYESLENKNIVGYIRLYDDFVGLKDFYPTAVKFSSDMNLYIALGVISAIASLISGFMYLTVAGRKKEGEPSKRIFIDRIPVDLHLCISVALGAGATAVMAESSNSFYISNLVGWIILAYALVMWPICFELCSSVARCVKCEKPLHKQLFVCIAGKFIAKIAVKLWRKTKALYKKIARGLSYTPKKFKKNLVKLSIIYVLANLLALGIIVLLCISNGFGVILAILLLIADIGVNIHIFTRVLDYIKNLDTIIDCSAEHKPIDIDTATLPQSLRTLAEGIEYTNTQMQNAVAKAVKDERLRTELITNVSHDLKTPLTSIITYVDLLSKCDIQDEKANEYIGVLEDKSAKLKRLIEDLIEASKVTSGNVSVNLTTISLAELCLQSTVVAQSDFEKAGLDLIVKSSEDSPVITADGAKTFRIIENLLSNARKYSAKGSRVYVDVYSENGYGVFEIKNISAQPLDISPDELTERFVRGDKSRNQEGNGLGLSIAKELCRLQKGDLQLIIDGDLFKARVKLPLA